MLELENTLKHKFHQFSSLTAEINTKTKELEELREKVQFETKVLSKKEGELNALRRHAKSSKDKDKSSPSTPEKEVEMEKLKKRIQATCREFSTSEASQKLKKSPSADRMASADRAKKESRKKDPAGCPSPRSPSPVSNTSPDLLPPAPVSNLLTPIPPSAAVATDLFVDKKDDTSDPKAPSAGFFGNPHMADLLFNNTLQEIIDFENIISLTATMTTTTTVENSNSTSVQRVEKEKKLRVKPYDPIEELRLHISKLQLKFMNPPRPGKKCLVLDIDYTMFDNENFSSRIEDAQELNRPYLHEFLQACYQEYDIVLWSATSYRAIETKMRKCGVYGHPDYEISLVLSKIEMFQLYTTKTPMEVKALQLLWTKFPQYYCPGNTIHIDDLAQNFTLNPQNGLKVKQYRDCALAKYTDKEFFFLSLYLLSIAKLPDISTLDHTQWKEYTLTWLFNNMNALSSLSLPPSFPSSVNYPVYVPKEEMICDWFGVTTNISSHKKPLNSSAGNLASSTPTFEMTAGGLITNLARERSLTAPVLPTAEGCSSSQSQSSFLALPRCSVLSSDPLSINS